MSATTQEPITREVSVPDNVWLFLSVNANACSNVEAPPFYGQTEAEMKACAEGFAFDELFCEIDGVMVTNVESFQATSPLYDFILPESKEADQDKGWAVA